MKLSISLRPEDVEFIDRYGGEHGVASRSEVVQRAVDALRAAELGPAYADAWAEWEVDEAGSWEVTVADGLPARGRRRAR